MPATEAATVSGALVGLVLMVACAVVMGALVFEVVSRLLGPLGLA